MKWLLILGTTAAFVSGQGVEGVAGGVMFDAPSQAVRMVQGVMGSAHLGGAVAEEVEQAWLAPDGRAGVVRRRGQWQVAQNLGRADELAKAMDGTAVLARWSPDGGMAVVVLAGGQVRLWKMAEMDWGEGAQVDGEIVSAAVDTSGRMWVGIWNGAGTEVAEIRAGAVDKLGAVRGRGLIAADGGRVYAVGERQAAAWEESAETGRWEIDRPDAPAGLEWAGRRLVAAFAGEKPELVIWGAEAPAGAAATDIAPSLNTPVARLELEFVPDRLEKLPGGTGLILKARQAAGEEIWVAQERGGEWGVWFVPAGE